MARWSIYWILLLLAALVAGPTLIQRRSSAGAGRSLPVLVEQEQWRDAPSDPAARVPLAPRP